MRVQTKEVAATMAFLLGIRDEILASYYLPDYEITLDRLREDQNACTIRYLSKIRSVLMQQYAEIDQQMQYNLKNLDSLDCFDKKEIEQLRKWGIEVIRVNYRVEKYLMDVSRYINEHINDCKYLFYDWVKWEYIRNLFVLPKCDKPETIKAEFKKYKLNIGFYPFQFYIHWDEPEDNGYLFTSDEKFLKFLYRINGEEFTDDGKFRDADDQTKINIYNFIESSEQIVIAIDCENSDVFKMYSVLKGLDEQALQKIKKITLYDDENTTCAWDWLHRLTKIPVEHIEVERVVNSKSLVDIKMTAGVCQDHYAGNVDSFIIVSSDSDYWGLISSLPNARFIVMYEYDKCGAAIKTALTSHGIYYCAIDDFCNASTEELKKLVLFDELEKHFDSLIGCNPWELTKSLYQNTYIQATEMEMQTFCTKYVKTLKLRVGKEGTFEIEINK